MLQILISTWWAIFDALRTRSDLANAYDITNLRCCISYLSEPYLIFIFNQFAVVFQTGWELNAVVMVIFQLVSVYLMRTSRCCVLFSSQWILQTAFVLLDAIQFEALRKCMLYYEMLTIKWCETSRTAHYNVYRLTRIPNGYRTRHGFYRWNVAFAVLYARKIHNFFFCHPLCTCNLWSVFVCSTIFSINNYTKHNSNE